MNDELKLRNRLKEARTEKALSQAQLAEMVGVSRNTISSIETGQFNPTAKLALVLCIALDKKFEELFFFKEAVMENYLLLIVGILLSVLGAVNIKGNIRTIHAYNRRNVREEDIPKYGRAVGTGTLIIGVSLAASFFVSLRNEAAVSFIVLPGLAVGLAFILYGQIKYNHGIF